jgi:cytochrome c peroxidase
VDPVDQELATLIARAGLEGDPAIYVDEAGKCRRRPLPDITDPLAQLGRALFFSMDLSGDKNVACASCHHPELGGGDAISLSIGPTDRPNLMGADRVRGLTDVADIHVPRNAQTTFNIAFWDNALFWDARVQALDPNAGFNGEGSPITTPDAESLSVPAPAAGANLTAAQAWFPVTETHEMAGSWGSLYNSRDELRNALATRMAQDPAWVQRFVDVCSAAGLPDTWVAACALPDSAARTAALVTFPHIAHAIGEYERSQVFTDSPWKAYVQGDPSAISEGAKQGALRFFQTVDEGGQNCFTCHKTDFFTDEKFHAVGSPQLGPGKEDGSDLGRARLTGNAAESYTFRTATLLNIEHTAPYFHSGTYATLAKAVGHYDNPNGRIFEYFGEGNKSDLNTRPWCTMEEFASIPACSELYSSAATHGGHVPEFLDPEVDGIKTLENNNGVYIEAFLRSLTDPRVADALALAPWVEPTSTLEVTDSSTQWDHYCDDMIERSADMNLRNKGFRWMVNGTIVDGEDVNNNEVLYDQFGVHYWELFSPAFTANSGIDQSDKQLAIAMMEVLQPAQRQLL